MELEFWNVFPAVGFDAIHYSNELAFYLYCKSAGPARVTEVMDAFDLEECEPVGNC